MNEVFKQAMSLGLVEKCVAAIIGILIIHGGFHLLEQTLPRRFGRADARYKVRKFVVFTGYLAILLFLAILFEDRLGRLSFALGVAGAGVAVALQDLLASIAGAFSIGFSKLYVVGDRVQIGETRGDVIDIGLLRTTLMEVGSWVGRDLYSGRIVRIPNNAVLKGSVFNYSQGFRFIWDQIKVVFTITSDATLARATLLRVANEVIGEYLVDAQNSWNAVSDDYRTENPAHRAGRGARGDSRLVGIYGQLRGGLHQTNRNAGSPVHQNRGRSGQQQWPPAMEHLRESPSSTRRPVRIRSPRAHRQLSPPRATPLKPAEHFTKSILCGRKVIWWRSRKWPA